jgi:hypothetical protein
MWHNKKALGLALRSALVGRMGVAGMGKLESEKIYQQPDFTHERRCALIFDPHEKFDFDTALSLALQVHNGQKDKAGEPYILHPIRVAQRMTSPFLRAAALLHDTLEDVDPLMLATTKESIRIHLGEAVLCLIGILTRYKGLSYSEYIDNLSLMAPARLIKIADLEDNLKPSREKNGWHMPTEMRVRYEHALGILRTVDAAARVVQDQGVMKNRGDITTSTS